MLENKRLMRFVSVLARKVKKSARIDKSILARILSSISVKIVSSRHIFWGTNTLTITAFFI